MTTKEQQELDEVEVLEPVEEESRETKEESNKLDSSLEIDFSNKDLPEDEGIEELYLKPKHLTVRAFKGKSKEVLKANKVIFNPLNLLKVIPIFYLYLVNLFTLIPATLMLNLFTGIDLSESTVSLLAIVFSIITCNISKTDKSLGEIEFTPEETKRLKDELYKLSDDEGYKRSVRKAVFYHAGVGEGTSTAYSKGMRKIVIAGNSSGDFNLGVITKELGHIYYKDNLLTHILYTQYNLTYYGLLKPMEKVFAIFILPMRISVVLIPLASVLKRIPKAINILTLTALQLFVSVIEKRAFYRADAYTFINGTHVDLIADLSTTYESDGAFKMKPLEFFRSILSSELKKVNVSDFIKDPPIKNRLAKLNKLVEKKSKDDYEPEAVSSNDLDELY